MLLTNPFTGASLNANPEGCNQYKPCPGGTVTDPHSARTRLKRKALARKLTGEAAGATFEHEGVVDTIGSTGMPNVDAAYEAMIHSYPTVRTSARTKVGPVGVSSGRASTIHTSLADEYGQDAERSDQHARQLARMLKLTKELSEGTPDDIASERELADQIRGVARHKEQLTKLSSIHRKAAAAHHAVIKGS